MSSAFLTSAYVDTTNPSVFEVVAQESLMNTLKPAFDKIIQVISNSSPQYLSFLHTFRDEIYLLLNSSLQLHYLNLLSSSFPENFYGLERKPVVSKKLPLRASYLCLVLLPYLQRKLDRLFEKLREDIADGLLYQEKHLNTLRSAFVTVYPYVHCTWELANLGVLLMFCLRKSKYHSLLAVLAGYNLIYIKPKTQQDSASVESRLYNKGGIKMLLHNLMSLMARGITFGLEIGSFFLQVVDHWYNNTESEIKMLNKIVPPPPSISGLKSGTCPLCGKQRRGDTVLTASGVVFCYTCITLYIRKKHRCPVTKVPAEESQLLRIFCHQD